MENSLQEPQNYLGVPAGNYYNFWSQSTCVHDHRLQSLRCIIGVPRKKKKTFLVPKHTFPLNIQYVQRIHILENNVL